MSLRATGASTLWVRLRAVGPDALSLQAFDPTGAVVVSVDALVLRSVSGEQMQGAVGGVGEGLFGVEWSRVGVEAAAGAGAGGVVVCGWGGLSGVEVSGDVAVWVPSGVDGGSGAGLGVGGVVGGVLEVVRWWLAEEGVVVGWCC